MFLLFYIASRHQYRADELEFKRLDFSVEFVSKFPMVFVGGERLAVVVGELEFKRPDFVSQFLFLLSSLDGLTTKPLDLFVSVSEGEFKRLDFV